MYENLTSKDTMGSLKMWFPFTANRVELHLREHTEVKATSENPRRGCKQKLTISEDGLKSCTAHGPV